ncbi:hypothetical protein AMATHDRAFT_2860 [Amanita thiersii Skay4041]|uniref:Uncharacterized protein n=1 Tax=Amanita thiersii Skay4041 TaxID=703135 RepID=A0A2A9NKS1_9AGAR|nr:hypothetical protein AMATHDRAFT_2860 [Amanita thiersii Skay4041]
MPSKKSSSSHKRKVSPSAPGLQAGAKQPRLGMVLRSRVDATANPLSHGNSDVIEKAQTQEIQADADDGISSRQEPPSQSVITTSQEECGHMVLSDNLANKGFFLNQVHLSIN